MVRSEVISKLFSKLNKKLSKSELEKILDTILNSVVDGIAENKASEWRTFGRFSPKKIKEKWEETHVLMKRFMYLKKYL